MKKIFYSVLLFLIVAYACKKDNYAAPDAALTGIIADAKGAGLQLEQGAGSARMKLDELSWSSNPIPLYLNIKQDGSFLNDKLFPGTYRVTPVEGPFYPIDSAQMLMVDIRSGNRATANFTVVPYLNVEWITDPSATGDKKITASFKFTRSAAPAGKTQPNLLDYQLFISTTQYVGNNNWDNTIVGGAVTATAVMEGQTLTITSTAAMKYATTYYVRVGVRVNDSFKKYNYTPVKTVNIAQ
ncbi:DUF3823 domain-containing protein [Chitinophaga sp. SYP-B3965]|uniref:DUF3823 domain-containing protein n=1 Tax=Chitinophaga sp. SYP-B3965 TaxID=2663120 RepID=UPI0012998D74|nr:DUF3823 domain-containing protein [Chitinophaga sp. SYP-B3965]MRG47534.1 DUF3823 domain-containing protein [Chitinophaga sp. SYP-B3965]